MSLSGTLPSARSKRSKHLEFQRTAMATYSMSANDHTDIKLRMSRESEKQELQEKLNNSSSGVPERFFFGARLYCPSQERPSVKISLRFLRSPVSRKSLASRRRASSDKAM